MKILNLFFITCGYLSLCYSYGASPPSREVSLSPTDSLIPSVATSIPAALLTLHQLIQQGDQYYNEENYLKAISYYQKGLIFYGQSYNEKTLLLATIYNKLGMSCLAIKDYKQTYFYLYEALTIRQKYLSIVSSSDNDLIKKTTKAAIVQSCESLGHFYFAINYLEAAILSLTAAFIIKTNSPAGKVSKNIELEPKKSDFNDFCRHSNDIKAPSASQDECDRHSIDDKKAPSQKVLPRHKPKLTKKRDLSCEQCGLKCRVPAVLAAHIRTHTGKKLFSCPICQKKFSVKHSIKRHLRVHTHEKPFQCALCQKKFSRKYSLNRHMYMHSGEKPFSCPSCPKKFSQKQALKKHIKCIHSNQMLGARAKLNQEITEVE